MSEDWHGGADWPISMIMVTGDARTLTWHDASAGRLISQAPIVAEVQFNIPQYGDATGGGLGKHK